ncbi:YkyA family protein [Metabacillus malikii]|uniref:DNA repair exonuclease SbcCD ATPase subunit n=1 Tax=Metabacillus malikii TaxID=1504265 RepID=A0ABT9ZIG9_9BACI|nr:YkyA family protein [Metabacillus malikii]MDQ0231333.1 DNA repair exonuclease SbcCD ATPase subunit [Metabacillus malikii]
MKIKYNPAKAFLAVFLILLIFLTGCFGPSPEEKMYTTLEEVVKLEETFKNQQEPLIELEKKETEIYNKIIDIGMSKFDEVVKLSEEGLKLVSQREEKIDMEYDSLMSAKEEFEKIQPVIEEIKDEALLEKANKLEDTMAERYSQYEELHDAYKKSISLDKELYTIFQNENLSLEELDAHLAKVNAAYQEVVKYNESFNQLTENYNKLKMDFYKSTDLNIKESE